MVSHDACVFLWTSRFCTTMDETAMGHACPQPRESGINAGWDIESGKQGRLVAQSPEHVCPKGCAVVTPALERSTLVQGAPCPKCAPAAPADRGEKVAAGSPTGCVWGAPPA